jgi:hypothetical protein
MYTLDSTQKPIRRQDLYPPIVSPISSPDLEEPRDRLAALYDPPTSTTHINNHQDENSGAEEDDEFTFRLFATSAPERIKIGSPSVEIGEGAFLKHRMGEWWAKQYTLEERRRIKEVAIECEDVWREAGKPWVGQLFRSCDSTRF